MLSKQLDQLLLDLAWSLWTELGVAGVKRKHQNCLIMLEELVLLIVTLSDKDPRLRDESLDWCAQYSHFCSISRLKTLIKGLGNSLNASFSKYAALLNVLSPTARWPILVNIVRPSKIALSGKSCLRSLESPALLNIRARGIFGVGARADLVTFFLMHPGADFSAADLTEIGYSKRNLADILEEFVQSGLFDKFTLRNQLRYRLIKYDQLEQMLGPIPKYVSWRYIFEIVLPLRECIKRNEDHAISTQVIEIRNLLINLQNSLGRLNLTPPAFQNDFSAYWKEFSEWLLEYCDKLTTGF